MWVYFNAIWSGFNDNYVKSVNFVNLDNLMGQLYWMYPEGCNSHWGGKPISSIRLKSLNHWYQVVLTFFYAYFWLNMQ